MLPALQARLDTAFPEFGFRPDALGWVATNEETTHRALGVRAERVVAHGPAPPGILIHGGDAIPWTAYLNGGQLPRGEAFVATVKELAARAGVDTAPIERAQPRDRRTDLLHDFFTLCRMELHGKAGAQARDYLQRTRPPRRSPRPLRSWRCPARGRYEAPARDGRLHRARDQPLGCTRRRALARSRLWSLARRVGTDRNVLDANPR